MVLYHKPSGWHNDSWPPDGLITREELALSRIFNLTINC
jgi:hypothetical protein